MEALPISTGSGAPGGVQRLSQFVTGGVVRLRRTQPPVDCCDPYSGQNQNRSAEPNTALAATPVLECADPIADRAALEHFWSDNFSADSRRFSSYFNNPCEPGAIWVLRAESGIIVGSTGLHTCRMLIDGQSHRAGHAVNLAVDPRYRTAGPAIQLQRAVLDFARHNGQSLVCGITARAAAVQKRVGYHQVGPIERWVKVLRTESKLQKHLKLPVLAKCAARGLDFALWGLSPEARRRLPSGWQVELPDRFDERFDRLWTRAAAQFPIATERSSAFLDWRFGECCDDPYQTLCVCDANRELAGYVVYRRQGPTVEISDLLCAQPGDLEILIVEALRHIRRLQPAVCAVSMSYLGSAALPSVLRKNGFVQRPEQKQLLVWANEAKLPLTALRDRDRWYLTAADLL